MTTKGSNDLVPQTDKGVVMRFTIRDLLWLTVLVALGVAWWIDKSRMQSKIDAIAEKLVAAESLLYGPPSRWLPVPNPPKD